MKWHQNWFFFVGSLEDLKLFSNSSQLRPSDSEVESKSSLLVVSAFRQAFDHRLWLPPIIHGYTNLLPRRSFLFYFWRIAPSSKLLNCFHVINLISSSVEKISSLSGLFQPRCHRLRDFLQRKIVLNFGWILDGIQEGASLPRSCSIYFYWCVPRESRKLQTTVRWSTWPGCQYWTTTQVSNFANTFSRLLSLEVGLDQCQIFGLEIAQESMLRCSAT